MKAGVEELTGYFPSESGIFIGDFLAIGGELWLVANWLVSPDERHRTPGLAIRIDLLPHQREGAHGTDITVNNPIPKAVLDGECSYAEGTEYQVIRGPSDHFGWIGIPRKN